LPANRKRSQQRTLPSSSPHLKPLDPASLELPDKEREDDLADRLRRVHRGRRIEKLSPEETAAHLTLALEKTRRRRVREAAAPPKPRNEIEAKWFES